jgi:hypothetical protein
VTPIGSSLKTFTVQVGIDVRAYFELFKYHAARTDAFAAVYYAAIVTGAIPAGVARAEADHGRRRAEDRVRPASRYNARPAHAQGARHRTVTTQADTIGVLGLALNPTEERNGYPLEDLGRIKELLLCARDLWRVVPEIENEKDKTRAVRQTFRPIHLADIVAVTPGT